MEIPQINYNHKYPVQVRYNDIDMAGHVNNAVHLNYFDFGRIYYFDAVFGNKINWQDKGFVVVSIKVDYIHPVYLKDSIQIYTKIVKLGNKSLEMTQKITDLQDNIKSVNTSILVGFDYVNQSSMEIPEEWKNMIADFEKDVIRK